ncbi:hypothetical protein LINPERHAP1_LOCUS24463 [Linum perenne]
MLFGVDLYCMLQRRIATTLAERSFSSSELSMRAIPSTQDGSLLACATRRPHSRGSHLSCSVATSLDASSPTLISTRFGDLRFRAVKYTPSVPPW